MLQRAARPVDNTQLSIPLSIIVQNGQIYAISPKLESYFRSPKIVVSQQSPNDNCWRQRLLCQKAGNSVRPAENFALFHKMRKFQASFLVQQHSLYVASKVLALSLILFRSAFIVHEKHVTCLHVRFQAWHHVKLVCKYRGEPLRDG